MGRHGHRLRGLRLGLRVHVRRRRPGRATPRPGGRWREIVDRCLDVLKPGASAGDLARAAQAGESRRPWLPHLYLAHGIGTNSAEMPLVGTDLGGEFDDGLVVAPGMVLVFEPVVWEDGDAGFRAEEIVAVTEDGHEYLSARDGGPRG